METLKTEREATIWNSLNGIIDLKNKEIDNLIKYSTAYRSLVGRLSAYVELSKELEPKELRRILTEVAKDNALDIPRIKVLPIVDGRHVDLDTIELDGIDHADYPDFCDAFICRAEFLDGTELDQQQLWDLEKQVDIHELVWDYLY